MNSTDIAKKASLLESKARATVNTLFAGEYQSAFKGSGMEVDELRSYAVGDEVRFIDWMVTARTGELHVKSFKEERDLTVIFALDVSASLNFGPTGRTKQDIMREVAAVLAFASFRKHDRVGLLLFSEGVEYFLPPAKGEATRAHIFRTLAEFQPQRNTTNISSVLAYLTKTVQRRAVVFLFSDFHAADFSQAMKVLAVHHDLVPVWIRSRQEKDLPRSGLTAVRDLETGQEVFWDTSDKRSRQAFAAAVEAQENRLRQFFLSLKTDSVELVSEDDYLPALVQFFERRDRHYGVQ
jgi:uncharacterized protein (DUF58 family)